MKKKFSFLFLFMTLLSAHATSHYALPSSQNIVRLDCEVRALTPSESHNTVPHISVRESTSLNWSGYAALTNLTHPLFNSVSMVSGNWIVPTLTPTPSNSYSSAWVGIDGYIGNSVEQIGTEHDWINGKPQYYAWFEMYPRNPYEIVGFPVNPCDHMGASVVYKEGGIFFLTIFNYTKKVYTQVPTSYTRRTNALRNSAEWIVEAPSSAGGVLPLADFNTVTFTNCLVTINERTGEINNKSWVHDPLTMENAAGVIQAVPSNLQGGNSLVVTRENNP